MTHQQKVERFQQMLRRRGFWVSNAIPPLWRLLWRLGLEVPPPYFLPFLAVVVYSGPLFGLLWGLLMWWAVWRPQGVPLVDAVMVASVAGVCFGLATAAFCRYQAWKLGLPSWDEFPSGPGKA